MIRPFLTALALVLFASNAQARPCIETGDAMRPVCGMGGARLTAEPRPRVRVVAREPRQHFEAGQVIGSRPSGCPHAYCGCGASLRVFGRIVPGLNLAANWLRFPRTSPAPGMVAARHGHVFVLEQHLGGNTWLAHDSNSGGGRTRIHARSIAGYTIVDPHGAA